MSDNYRLRESVANYLTDLALTAGVDAILSSAAKLPADLESQELPLFYEALWSARQVQCEFALDLDALWNEIWGDALAAAKLTLVEPGESRDWEDSNLHPEAVWENDEIVRHACGEEGDDYSFWVSLTSQGLSCGCNLGSRPTPDGLSLIDGYYNSQATPVTREGEVNLDDLVRIAEQVPSILEAAAASDAAVERAPSRGGGARRR